MGEVRYSGKVRRPICNSSAVRPVVDVVGAGLFGLYGLFMFIDTGDHTHPAGEDDHFHLGSVGMGIAASAVVAVYALSAIRGQRRVSRCRLAHELYAEQRSPNASERRAAPVRPEAAREPAAPAAEPCAAVVRAYRSAASDSERRVLRAAMTPRCRKRIETTP